MANFSGKYIENIVGKLAKNSGNYWQILLEIIGKFYWQISHRDTQNKQQKMANRAAGVVSGGHPARFR